MLAIIKAIALAGYGGFGLFLVWMAATRRTPRLPISGKIPGLFFGLLTGLMLVRFGVNSPLYLAGVASATVLSAIWNRRQVVFAAGVATLSLSLAWWLQPEQQPQGWWRLALFIPATAAMLLGLNRPGRATRWAYLVFALAGITLLTDFAAFAPGSQALAFLAHHQGAYIGSALHVLAGLVPFYDVPLQYGLGPALTVAAACKVAGCWNGVALLTTAATVLMGLLILRMAADGKPTLAATVAVFVAVFLWPGFPDLGTITAATPSVGGMRYLPVTLVAYLLFAGWFRLAIVAMIPAVLWSPEVAFMTIAVFGVHETARLGLLQSAAKTFVIVAGSFTALLLVHHLIYGVWMQPDVVIEYILHVPGPLPIDPLSDFLFLAAAMALAGWTVLREQGDRRALIVATLLFAASSYYLGRSHPNNICNLMPFVVLVALRARPSPLVRLGIATSIAAITLSYWTYVPFGIDRADPVEVRIAKLDPGMNEIRSHIANPDRLGIADIGQSLNRHPDESLVWTPMDPYSLWSFVPSERRRLYIRRSAQRLRRSGWVILQGDAAKLLSEFEAGYNVAELSRTGEYTVAKLIPKP